MATGRVISGGYPFFQEIAQRIEDAVEPGDLPILTRGSLGITPVPDRYWFYNTEDLHHANKRSAKYMAMLDRAERVFDYAEPNLQIYARAEFRPIKLRDVPDISNAHERDIPVLFFGYMTPRRQKLTDALNATCITGFHGDDLTRWINRAKVVLCVSAWDNRTNDAFRVFPALERGGRLLVETCQEEWFNRTVEKHATVVPYNKLEAACRTLLES